MVGILLFIFGDEYDKIGSACLRFSRQHTSLPVHVVTNIRQSDRWKGLDVSFQYVDVPTKDNRDVKTQMYKYTPFHRTLYMDCDAVVQNPGLEDVFSMLDEKDVALYRFDRWEKGHKVLSLYKEAMQMFNVGLPLNIWQGGFLAFHNTEASIRLFKLWNDYWKQFGRRREMPCLACAEKKTKDLRVSVIPRHYFTADSLDDNVIVQHNAGNSFIQKFNLPPWERLDPYTKPGDFRWADL